MALQPGGLFSGLWLALIGWFLSNAAEATAAQAGVESSLRGIRVRDAMDATPPAVSPNESVADLVRSACCAARTAPSWSGTTTAAWPAS